MKAVMRRTVWNLVRWGVTATAITVIVVAALRQDWSVYVTGSRGLTATGAVVQPLAKPEGFPRGSLNGSRLAWLAACLLCGPAIGLAAVVRWRLLTANDPSCPTPRWFAVVWARSQVLALLPVGQVGGDVYRCERLRTWIGSTDKSIAVVLMDRCLGLVGMVLVIVIAWLAVDPALALASIAVVGVVAGLSYLARRQAARGVSLLVRRLPRGLANAPGLARDGLMTSLQLFSGHHRVAVMVVLSVVIQLIICLSYLFADRAVGLATPAACYFVAVPLLILAQYLPIHIAGIGIVEGGLWAFLAAWNAGTAADAIAVSVVVRTIGLLWLAMLALSFLVSAERSRTTETREVADIGVDSNRCVSLVSVAAPADVQAAHNP